MTTQPKLARITKRPEYLAIAKTGRKWVTPAFILQAKPSKKDQPPRAGYTASKKVGNAVVRSKVRRRLKEASRQIIPELGEAGWEYVFIGRQSAFDYDFKKLLADMRWALVKLAAGADLKPRKQNGKSKTK